MRGDKTKQVKVRITQAQYEQIVELSENGEESISDVLRYFIEKGLSGKLPKSWTTQQRSAE